MKGLFISLYDITSDNAKGIRRKLEAQVKYFRKNCDCVDWIYRIGNGDIVCNEEKIFKGKETSQPLVNSTFDFIELKKHINVDKYDFIYIRYLTGNLGLLIFVKYLNLKEKKVIIEIPTYPYLEEFRKDIKGKLNRILDNFVTKKLNKYVYRIVCTNKDKQIFNIKTVQIDNGVDLESVKFIRKVEHNKKYINAIAVASICTWHGYDRFINSMYQYKEKYGELNVKFYLVGDGRPQDLVYLKDIVNEYNLNDYVIFTGSKNGDELDKIYNKMDFAVSSLALFRAGGGHNPIKTKEYVAKGLPIVTGYDDSIVDSSLEYVFKVPEDESIFSLEEIIEWYKNGKFKSKVIRDFAEKNVSWNVQIQKIISSVNSGN